eukprot:symbB.v1.2.032901.t1/scaffold4016.1/size46338/3
MFCTFFRSANVVEFSVFRCYFRKESSCSRMNGLGMVKVGIVNKLPISDEWHLGCEKTLYVPFPPLAPEIDCRHGNSVGGHWRI